jgi:diketogulonate reductase-like aldo/keto reductase
MMTKMNNITRRKASKLIGLGVSSILAKGVLPIQTKQTMIERMIPSSGEKIPIVGVGTWQTFDVGKSEKERKPLKEVLQILVDNGGSLIDSSPMYGRSEGVVGELTTELKIKQKIFEATKVWTSGREAGIEQMQNSMNLMKARPMDLMQVHNLLDWRTHMKTLKNWKEEGKIRYLGVTHYHKGAYAELEQIMKTESLDFIQINYNLLVRDAAERILPLAQDKGIAVLINRPYNGGSLFSMTKGKSLPEWASEFQANSWGQVFLKFILANPAVTCVIPGTSTAKHMKDNVQAGFGDFPSTKQQEKLIRWIND